MEGRIQNVHGAAWPQLKDWYTGEETMNFLAGKFRVGEELHYCTWQVAPQTSKTFIMELSCR
jgi:hypothetical protein